MAGALNLIHPETIGYYFEHWNSNLFSVSIVMVLILILTGYFYGCVFRKFIKPLKNMDCTFLGVFFIMGVFQIFIYYAVTVRMSTAASYNLLKILVFSGPILCAATLSNPLPSWKHLASFGTGILIAIVLCIASSKLNTNNIFFDSVYYLSEVLESSTRENYANMNYYLGEVNFYGYDKFHSFQGYYYFWGMLLRWARDMFHLTGSLTPVYLWGASILYFMALGSLIISSVNVLFKKQKWAYALIAIAVLSPYYTNYFNTTLAFFGNTLRTVMIGYVLLLVYLYLKSSNNRIFMMLAILYCAAISASSTSFVLIAITTAALFFTMCFKGETDWKSWMMFIISCIPLFHYALLLVSGEQELYIKMIAMALIPDAILILVAWLIRKHLDIFCKLGRYLCFIVLAGLVVLSFLWRNGQYPYSFYFESRSYNDMTNNFTSHVSSYELIRNLMLYALLVLLILAYKNKKGRYYRVFLYITAALFLNPLTEPAVATLITSDVYSRVFDMIINPFSMIFLLYNAGLVLKPMPVQYGVLTAAALVSFWLGRINWNDYYSKTLLFKDDGWNWENKVSEDSWDMYDYIQENLTGDENNRPLFLSQDISLKGYVSYIQLVFGASNFRDSLENEVLFEENRDIMTMLYPEKLTNDILVNDQQADYSKLSRVLSNTGTDYLVMRNTIAVWDDRGWYTKAYQSVLDSGQCTVEYENDTWIILKVDHGWSKPGKNETRYWVHRIETQGVQEENSGSSVNVGG